MTYTEDAERGEGGRLPVYFRTSVIFPKPLYTERPIVRTSGGDWSTTSQRTLFTPRAY